MKHFNIILFIGLSVVALSGCKSSKTMESKGSSPYERKPIVEVKEDDLAVEAMMVEAKLQQEIGNSQEALKRYRAILQKSPGYAPAHFEISQIMEGMNRIDSAIFHCQKAIEGCDTNKWYWLLEADLYGRRGNLEKEVAAWESLIKQHPDEIDYYYELSNTYITANNIPKAVEALNRVEKMIGVTEPISLQKQKLWSAIGRNDKANKELEGLVEAFPMETKYCSMLAQGLMNAHEYEKAKKYFEKVLEANPHDGFTHLSLAQYYQHAGDDEAAFESLKKGLTYSDLTTQGKLQVLSSFYPAEEFYGKHSKYAFELMDLVMRNSDDSLSFALFYGDVLMRQEKYAEAAHQFENYMSVDSSKYDLWEALLICENEIPDNEDRALGFARRASKLFPFQTLPYYLQGLIACRREDYSQAIELLGQCEKLGFNNGYLEAECYGLLAECYHQLGKDEESFAYFDKYLALHPKDYLTLNNYAYYLAEAGKQLDKAESMAKIACTAEPTNATYLDTYAWALHKNGKKKEAKAMMQKALQYADKDDETYKKHWEAINED